MSLHFCPQQILQLLDVCTALYSISTLAPASPQHRHGEWAEAGSEGGISFALPPQPTAHLCCTAVQDAMIPAAQEAL